jgi:hypothetical protein
MRQHLLQHHIEQNIRIELDDIIFDERLLHYWMKAF